MLLDKQPGFDMRHTLISEVKTSAQVIISGHEHTGFGVVRRESDGILFINPGALCRLSAHVAEIERTIQVALLTVENGQATAELIPLKSARPGHEVLSREHIEAAAERESRIEEFLKLLASEGEAKFLEVREIVEDIAARENLPEAIKAEALRRIGEARERLGVVTNDL
jgi:exonuclease SbcD